MTKETNRARSIAPAVLSWLVLALVVAALLSGFFLHPGALGGHDWDQMEAHRVFVVKAIREFGQFPFWDPYGCGGYPAWGSPESATVVVSPLLAAYLTLPLGDAIRVEVVTLVVALVLGLHFFARRYVSHPLALGFACLVGALNSRTALQAAVGHTWHLAYAGLPWVLGAFDRALPRDRGPIDWAWVAIGAAVMALMAYAGGVYPVPHTVLCLGGLAAYRAWAQRSTRPLVAASALAVWAGLLAAPKLLPVADTMRRFPRLTRSRETVDPREWLRMFVSSVDGVPDHRAMGLDYMWHEYGQYIGILPLGLVLWGTLRKLPADPALRSLRALGWALMVLALGGWGPWVLLHLLPLFRSQRVPTRFTYPALMLLAVVAASEAERMAPAWHAAWERACGRALDRRSWWPRFHALNPGGVVVWAAFLGSAALIAREDMRATAPWFALPVPPVAERPGGYAQTIEVPAEYAYGDGQAESPLGTNGVPGLLLHEANAGALRCNGFSGLNQDAPLGPDGRRVHLGARGIGDPLYRGEAWAEAEQATVAIDRWSPGEVTVTVVGGQPGSLVVLNQNWDPGWTANGVAALDRDDVNAYRLTAASETVVFRYRPRSLSAGLGLLAGGVLLLPVAWSGGRRRRRTGWPWRARADADRLRDEMPREELA